MFEKEINQEYILVGKVISINQGENFYNLTLKLTNNKDINIKLNTNEKQPIINKIYQFKVICILKKERKILINKEFDLVENILTVHELYRLFSHFFPCTKVNFTVTQKIIENYLYKIKNTIIFNITKNLYEKNKKSFLIHPAALKMHHTYYGGLSIHTVNILKTSDIFIELFPYLNVDLIYAGIILHDMAKIRELNDLSRTYTKEGVLLGHLVMMNNDITEEALLLNYQNKEEVLILKHIIISHHGLLNFGALQKPKIGEALLIWYLDTIDSQFSVLGENLKKIEKGNFTESISVLNKNFFYKPNI
ncbi:CMP-binding protein [Candidatus Phytoplasma prunorum]|uniref:CMP-binding protein n=1 Tax=Candidatus Phytoplasma prunorum TaxID=47565 RepID=UPI002FF21811